MQRMQSGSVQSAEPHPHRQRQQSTNSSRIKVSGSGGFRGRNTKGPTSASKLQQQQQIAATILQRRERLRVYEEGEDVTPRNLVHPLYGSLDDRRTAFDAIGQLDSSHAGSVYQLAGATSQQQARASLATVSSYSSIYTLDVVLAAKTSRTESFESYDKPVTKRGIDVYEDDEDAPSQFHLPRLDSRERFQLTERVTVTLKETDTFFFFELPQLTEIAQSDAGEAVVEENERYSLIAGGIGRKTMSAESQTPLVYTKTRGTFVGREERKNRATFVNNWVMHDTYSTEKLAGAGEPHEENRFKFPDAKNDESRRDSADQLAVIAARDEYEDAARIALRILAMRNFENAQRRFAGVLVQDPCDPDLQLTYELELLWRHECPGELNRPAYSFRWNPVNPSLLAVGYGAITKSHSNEEPEGLVLIWCAKNPSIPDRYYEFNSPVSDLDWSRTRPNLLAIGFYDGTVRVIDISKRQLTIIRQSERKTSPSYGPHWQIQWWLVGSESLNSTSDHLENLYTSNQDGRIAYYTSDEDFVARELVRLYRVEGKIPGIPRVNHCLGHAVPISQNPGALQLRRHPVTPGVYLVGTEEGCVHRCSTSQPHGHLDCHMAHDGPIYHLEYSPFCEKLLLTCGADWTARIWAEGLTEPLLTYGTRMASVNAAAWSPRNSTIFASAVANEICLWDIRRKTHRPASVTRVAPSSARIQRIEFTHSGEQLVAIDDEGTVYVYGLEGMPLPAFDQKGALVDAVEKALLTKPELLKKLKKLGSPFGEL